MKPGSLPTLPARIAAGCLNFLALMCALLLFCGLPHAAPAQQAQPDLQNARGSAGGAAVPQLMPAERVSQEPHRFLAHWAFDELSGTNCADASGHGCDAPLEQSTPGFSRARGIHGQALRLRGAHALRARVNVPGGAWPAITFSAWVRPTDLSGFREIFRQECPNRLLFSFQEGGGILSLGLNIGGYVECDPAIQPGEVLDGQWHLCTASFDGKWMRVYLDGREIGSLQRPGRIAVSPEVPTYIGSSGNSPKGC